MADLMRTTLGPPPMWAKLTGPSNMPWYSLLSASQWIGRMQMSSRSVVRSASPSVVGDDLGQIPRRRVYLDNRGGIRDVLEKRAVREE